MLWSFCSKGGGVFLWLVIFFAGVLDFFSMAVDFWSKGICVF